MRTSVFLSSWTLDPAWDPMRRPPRDAAIRKSNYEDEYDFLTVFFDVFWDEFQESIIILSPPYLNLTSELELQFTALPSCTPCPFVLEHRVLVDRIILRPPRCTTALLAESTIGRAYFAPQPNLSREFSGSRVLFTLNKDNDLVWIRDWATFYAHSHGCNAVVVYDNGSNRYSAVDLGEMLTTVPGITRSAVVEWNFPYGVFDIRESPALYRHDSLYCQWGVFEHARLRLFRTAQSVCNADIDELVISETGRSVFEAAERSPTGHLLYRGFWIGGSPEGVTDEISLRHRHRHFWMTTVPREGCPPKWTVAPGNTPRDVQWDVHAIRGLASSVSRDFVFRHFRAINTNWNVDRPDEATLRTEAVFDTNLVEDLELKSALNRVFPARDALTLPSPPGEKSAYAMRLMAGRFVQEGRLEAARIAALKARQLAPQHANFAQFHADVLKLMGRDAEAVGEELDANDLRELSPHYIFQMGYECCCRGDFVGGSALVRRAIDLAPELVAHAVYLARMILSQQGDVLSARAVIDLASIYSTEAQRDDLIAVQIELMLREGVPEEAWELASREAARRPDSPAALMNLSRCLIALDRSDDALRQMNDAAVRVSGSQALAAKLRRVTLRRYTAQTTVVNIPDFTSLQFLHLTAKTLDGLGRLTEAIPIMREVVSADHSSPEFLVDLAEMLQRAGDLEGAKSAGIEARELACWTLEITPATSATDYHRRVERVRDLLDLARADIFLQHHDDAISTFGHAVALMPSDPLTRRRLVNGYIKMGLLDAAIAEQRHLVALTPNDPREHLKLARMIAMNGHPKEAIEILRHTLALFPRSVGEFQISIGRLCEKVSDKTGALEAYHSAVFAKPDRADLWFSLSRVLRGVNRWEESFDAARQALTRQPDDPRYSFAVGTIAFRLERYDDAEEALLQTIASDANDPRPHYLCSILYARRGMTNKALAEAQFAALLAPQEHRYAKRLKKLERAERRQVNKGNLTGSRP